APPRPRRATAARPGRAPPPRRWGRPPRRAGGRRAAASTRRRTAATPSAYPCAGSGPRTARCPRCASFLLPPARPPPAARQQEQHDQGYLNEDRAGEKDQFPAAERLVEQGDPGIAWSFFPAAGLENVRVME